MHRHARPWVALTLCPCLLVPQMWRPALAAGGAPFTVEDLMMLNRLSDPQVSPDGRYVVFVQRATDLGANKTSTSLWLLALVAGAQPQRLTDATALPSSWLRTPFRKGARS